MRSEHALRPQSCEGIIATIAADVDAQNMQADIKEHRAAGVNSVTTESLMQCGVSVRKDFENMIEAVPKKEDASPRNLRKHVDPKGNDMDDHIEINDDSDVAKSHTGDEDNDEDPQFRSVLPELRQDDEPASL